MGNGCYCCKKKTTNVSPVVLTTEVTAPRTELKEKPYGYVRLYAGARTIDNKYASPIISLHTYNKAQQVTTRTKTTLELANTGNKRSGSITTPAGPSSSTNTEKEQLDENVQCIPVENIISISYSADIKKEFEIQEVVQKRPRPPKSKLGCCGRFKECLRETFCCCPRCPCKCCKPPAAEKPQYETTTKRNMTAKRMILMDMQYIRYTNVHIPSHVKVLPDNERNNFYKEYFDVEPIQFYLVNNTETEENHFALKSIEAEELCRVIVQLRNMSDRYPSPGELDEILRQKQAAIYGDEIRH